MGQVRQINAREISGAGRIDKIRKITLSGRVNNGNKKKIVADFNKRRKRSEKGRGRWI